MNGYTGELEEAANAFTSNYDRVRSLILQVPFLAHLAAHDETCKRLAAQEAFGQPDMTQQEIEASETRGIFAYHYKQFFDAKSNSETDDEYADRVAKDGMERVERFHGTCGTPLIDYGLRAVISSAVILSWSSIEVMFGDLWEMTVNSCPKPLAFLRGSSNRISGHAGDKGAKTDSGKLESRVAEMSDGEESTLIGLNLGHISRLTRGTFRIANCVGTILRSQGEVAFTSLREVRTAYSRAFPNKVCDAVDRVLGDKSFDALAELRHLLVHKGGVVDKKYADKCMYLKSLPTAAEGNAITLDGGTACAVIRPTIECGLALIREVDEWVSAHRE